MSNNKQQIEQLLRQNKVLHEAIIDLYLQVKIRSNEEIDHFNEGQFNKERDRLLKFDSLTVLDYIRTSIEILMQMKLEEEKMAKDEQKNTDRQDMQQQQQRLQRVESKQSSLEQPPFQTPLSSTTKSLDLPPKEYEQQLQQYESEVRNHIKVEQQLKLHIEVLQDKIDDLEKEKEITRKEFEKEKKELQTEILKKLESQMVQKDKEIDRLNNELQKAQQLLTAQNLLMDKQSKINQIQSVSHQQQNLLASIKQNLMNSHNSANNQAQRANTSQSKSPPSNTNMQYSSTGKKIKTMSQGKSPYLNDCFFKLVSGTQISTGAVSNGQPSSNNSSAKSHRKGSQSQTQDQLVNESNQIQVQKKPKQTGGQQIAGNSIAENMKIIAAIQRMRLGNQGGLQQMNTAHQSNNNSISQASQNHKKNKSFSHYGSGGSGSNVITTNNTQVNSQQRTSNVTSVHQHYMTTNNESIPTQNNWVNDQTNFNSFQNEAIQIRDMGGVQEQQNNKILMMGGKQQQNVLGRIQVIDSNRPQHQQNNYMQATPDLVQPMFTKLTNDDSYSRKKVKKAKAKRDSSSQSGRGSQNQTQQNFVMNSNYGTSAQNHHRVYSIDMIESLSNNMNDGNMNAANHQDIIKHVVASKPSQQIEPQKIKKISQQQISQQRGRPKSQIGNSNINLSNI